MQKWQAVASFERDTKKKVIFFFLPFFSPSLFTAGKKIKKGMKKMKMKKKEKKEGL